MHTAIKATVSGILLAGISMVCAAGNAQPTSSQPHRGAGTPAPAMVLAPTAGAEQAVRNPQAGCWVRLMDNVDKMKGNEYMTILGSKYMPDLKTASGEDWARKMDGINIGPDALVTVFGEPGYSGRGVILRPNQVVQDFHKDLGFVNAIESMKVDCKA
ncbi:MAG: hypothetical protein ACJ8G3_12345 [Burkholderiaceae bacterium]